MSTLEKVSLKELKLSEQQFSKFCAANRDLRIERDKYGHIIIALPVTTEIGFYEGVIHIHLYNWNRIRKNGFTFSANVGFTLSNTAVRSPDASWLSMEKWEALTDKEKQSFAPVCPEFVVEIRSKSDILKEVKEKMLEWIESGAQLGWLIDVKAQKTYIYRADGSIEIV